MFAPLLNEALFHLLPARPGQLLNMDAWSDVDAQTKSDLQRAAEKALGRPLPVMLASDAIEGRQVYAQARRDRREMLLALTLGVCAQGAPRYIMKLIDVAWAICEESAWRDEASLPEGPGEEMDAFALETASLLAWTHQLAGEEMNKIDPRARLRIERELQRRVFSPFTAREAPAWARSRAGRALPRACAVLSCLILADPDDRERWLGIRRCLLQMDEVLRALPESGVHPLGLAAWQADAEALSEAATLLLMATGGDVDARNDTKFLRICDYPASAHLSGGSFINPDGEISPSLSGEALFRVGECADNAALKRLGAALGAGGAEEEVGASVTARVLGALMRRAYRAEPAVFPERNRVFLPGGALMQASESGFRAALCMGSMSAGHIDAGNIYLYLDGKAIFTDLGPGFASADEHSLPSVNGVPPTLGFGGAKDAEARFEDAFTYLSVNLSPGFPDGAGVVSWQRSIMISPMEKRARIIEAYDLRAPAERVRYRFITPIRPQPDGERAFILGDARFSWETALTPRVDKVGRGWRISLDAPEGGMRGNTAFIVSQK